MSVINNAIYTVGLVLCSGAAYQNITPEDIEAAVSELTVQEYGDEEEIIVVDKILSAVQTERIYRDIPQNKKDEWLPHEWLAKMMFTERNYIRSKNQSQTIEELRHIAATAIHRALMNGESIRDVCSNKKQYSGVMRRNNKHWMRQPSKVHLQIAYDMIQRYKEGVVDEYSRSYFFANMHTVSRQKNRTNYNWFITLEPIGKYGAVKKYTHTFFASKKWDAFLKRNPNVKLTDKHL